MTIAGTANCDTRPDFTSYVAARRPALLAAAHGITGDRHSAEDLLQTTLARVYLSWDKIRDHRAADAYVRRAMVNQHHSWWRRGWRRHENVVADPAEAETAAAVVDPDLAEDERARLWRMVRGLPERQRAAVVLRYYEQLTEAETAQVLGVSVGAVKSNTSRGVAALRRQVAAQAGVPAPAA